MITVTVFYRESLLSQRNSNSVACSFLLSVDLLKIGIYLKISLLKIKYWSSIGHKNLHEK
jgi:hypothetical protein